MSDDKNKTAEANKGKQRALLRSSSLVGLAVMGSRLLGLLREKVIAHYFSAGVAVDALYAAFRIPNLLRDLFAEGVLSKAFISVFTTTQLEDGEDAAWRLANRTLNLLGLVLAAVTLLGIYFSPEIVSLITQGKGFDLTLDPDTHFGFTSKRDLTVTLTRIMFPFLTLVSFAAISMGILNSKNIFAIPAWSSSFFNITAMIVGIAGYYLFPMLNWHPAAGMAAGFLLGGAAQFFIQVPALRRAGFRWRPLAGFRNQRVQQVLLLMGPAVLGASALQLNIFMNTIFTSEGEGWLTWLTRSFRLLHLPIGVFGVAISTVALPSLAKLVAEGQLSEFKTTFLRAFRLVLFFAMPATAGLILLSVPLSRLIFEGGATQAQDTIETAKALSAYAIGLCGFASIKVVTDAYYAFKDTKTPVKISLFTVALNIALNAILIWGLHYSHTAIAFSTALTVSLNCILLLLFLPQKTGSLGLSSSTGTLAKMGVATLLLAGIVWFSASQIETALDTSNRLVQLLHVFFPMLLGTLAYLFAGRMMQIEELQNLQNALFRRSKH